MKSTFLCLTLLVSLAACETSLDGLIGIPGGGGLTAAQASGNWSFTVQRTSALACTSGSLTNGQVLTTRLDVLSDGSLATTSFWQNPPTTLVRSLTGSELSAPARVHLHGRFYGVQRGDGAAGYHDGGGVVQRDSPTQRRVLSRYSELAHIPLPARKPVDRHAGITLSNLRHLDAERTSQLK